MNTSQLENKIGCNFSTTFFQETQNIQIFDGVKKCRYFFETKKLNLEIDSMDCAETSPTVVTPRAEYGT